MTMARIVDRLGMERVLTFGLALGAFGALAIGSLAAPLWALSALIFVAGLGGASQAGIKALSGLIYPARMRATGAGWALGVARLGAIAGPLVGGLMLARGYQGHNIFVCRFHGIGRQNAWPGTHGSPDQRRGRTGSLTSSEVASRAVSPASRFLPASRNSFDQR